MFCAASGVVRHRADTQRRLLPLPHRRAVSEDVLPRPFFPVRTRWTLALNNAVTAPPAADADAIYFPIEGERLAAYEASSGTLRWVAPFGATSAPAAGGGFVFAGEPAAIVALRADSGALAWQLPFTERIARPLVWNNGWLLITTIDGGLIALRAEDGHPLWRLALGSPAHARPAVSGERVYVPTEDGRLVAIDIDGGRVAWERRLGGPASDILAFDDRLFAGSKDNFFYCLDTRDGGTIWRWRTGADVIGLPVVDDKRVYFVSLDNVLRALNTSNGVQQWQRPLPLRPDAGPLKIGATLLVSGVAPVVHGYSAATGAAAGDLAVPGELASAPIVVEDRATARLDLIVVTRDIAKGAAVTSMTSDLEPKLLTPLAPLPNPVVLPPALPRSQAAP